MEDTFMKRPCIHCPFRHDVKPFLTPSRGAELAYAANNSYNSFPCHKTTESDDESEDGMQMCTNKTKECAGFLTLQHNETGCSIPEGFEPAYDIVYEDINDMVDAYEDQDD